MNGKSSSGLPWSAGTRPSFHFPCGVDHWEQCFSLDCHTIEFPCAIDSFKNESYDESQHSKVFTFKVGS